MTSAKVQCHYNSRLRLSLACDASSVHGNWSCHLSYILKWCGKPRLLMHPEPLTEPLIWQGGGGGVGGGGGGEMLTDRERSLRFYQWAEEVSPVHIGQKFTLLQITSPALFLVLIPVSPA